MYPNAASDRSGQHRTASDHIGLPYTTAAAVTATTREIYALTINVANKLPHFVLTIPNLVNVKYLSLVVWRHWSYGIVVTV